MRPPADEASSPGADDRLVSARAGESDRFEASLRPRTLAEYVGQSRVKENLAVLLQAAAERGEPLDHICGPRPVPSLEGVRDGFARTAIAGEPVAGATMEMSQPIGLGAADAILQ